ncbi:addiction module antidote protein [Kingella negevensis]|uniref:HTH cro/C1-type domain-containing protein n=1 Tax=Kingella negevensis TaxID=1522312 RepID=A0A238HGX7_9NEIS|nr:addiction module antidote protein [Kingella negevensis]MDK4680312.1 putative addiction module antidote protein [Kingella negevensis]MDK4681967.1 putative addiction module antidote protein [Kingella negevensis]MDK4684802.1 putative addiction module antidote protein [Kingella negevensis]MDK4688670.1 putative addiction module antidote protein [Kingella negevensis]MDK4690163.1 putative addiction module antidote protein [Kingella negevensis]
MKTKTIPFDPTRYLTTEEEIAIYLEVAAEEAAEANDDRILLKAIETAAKAKGIMQVAKEAGVSRESLYKSLSDTTKPRYETISKVLNALGMKITVTPKHSAKA